MGTINLGNDYVVSEDGNGDLVITHSSNGDVLQYDASVDEISALADVGALTTGRLSITPQDLSGLSLGASEDGKMYLHNGDSSITADGGTTSAPGYYVWSNSDSEFKTVVAF